MPETHSLRFLYVRNRPLVEAQNLLVEQFLAEPDNEWMFSVEDDMIYLPGTLMRLLSWNKPVVSALYFKREQPHVPHVYRGDCGEGKYRIQIDETLGWLDTHKEMIRAGYALLETRPDDALVPVDFTGVGCVVIHRSVFESAPAPWFALPDIGNTSDKFFYQKAISHGFTPYVDLSVICGHLARDVQVGAMDFVAYSKIVKFEEDDDGTSSQ